MGNKTKRPINERIKAYYEDRQKLKLHRRTPVLIRCDGNKFSSFTKGFERPFDKLITKAMQDAMVNTFNSLDEAVVAYTQSDEITFLLIDYKALDTDVCFDYDQQKLSTITTSTVSTEFLKSLIKQAYALPDGEKKDFVLKKLDKLIRFDGRSFNVPREEVMNAFLGRYRDGIRNSVASVARSIFSHLQLKGKNSDEQKEMIKSAGKDVDTMYQGNIKGSFVYSRKNLETGRKETVFVDCINIDKFKEIVKKFVYCDVESE